MDDDLTLNIFASNNFTSLPTSNTKAATSVSQTKDKSKFKRSNSKKRNREDQGRRQNYIRPNNQAQDQTSSSFQRTIRTENETSRPVESSQTKPRLRKEASKRLEELQNKDTHLQAEEFVETAKLDDRENRRKTYGKKNFEDLTKMKFDNNEDNYQKEEEKIPVSRDVISADNFGELDIDERLKKVLSDGGYNQMTNIQKSSIPVILNSRNVLVKSETGSGKTLAYCVPLIDHLVKYSQNVEKISRNLGTLAIIFSPTRELCIQIENTLKKILRPFVYIVPGCLMGGEQVKKEKARLRKGLTILICTPGRLLYHINNTKSLIFDKLQYLIFDESDRILDMGFEKEMTQCLQGLKRKSSRLFENNQDEDCFYTSNNIKVNLVSATLGKKVNNLSEKLMRNEVRVGFEAENAENENNDEENLIDLDKTIPKTIEQHYMFVPNHKFKLLYLLIFLNMHQNSKIIVFMSTCDCVNYLAELLTKLNWLNLLKSRSDQEQNSSESITLFTNNIYCLHGKMKHSERKVMFGQFDKLEGGGVLISTDVASRGLDFKDVKWVVQFDICPSLKEYANRIGRTARLNEHGSSLVFINEDTEKPFVDCLTKFGSKLTEMNRFKMIQEFAKYAQEKYNRIGKGTRVFTSAEVEVEDEKFEILLFLKLLLKDTIKENTELDKLELKSYNSANKARYGFGIQLRKLFKISEINTDDQIKLQPRHKTKANEIKHKRQKN